MEEDHERLCGVEGRLLKEKGNRLVQCTSDDDCLPPSQCHTTGYCCMIALNQEPPPVGCPIGTRPLVNSSGAELTCSSSVPDSCPGGALCYTDTLTNVKRCCGNDPGQGCPSGSRVLLTAHQKPQLCTPGRADAICPRGFLCQWSHLIDRYQCCEPDNGCPRHQTPQKTEFGIAISCSPGGAPCPDGGGCHFNFWTASYQCCKLDVADLCPVGQVPFLVQSNGEPKSCKNNFDCPSGYHCGENSVCCGTAGSCPADRQAAQDKYGRLTACTSRNGNTCPSGSECMDTSTVSQQLCCEQIEYTCPGYSTPYPSQRFPQKCNIMDTWACGDKQCMPSNIPNVHICCQSTIIRQRDFNPCPAGWMPNDNIVTFCTPSFQTSTCPGFSSCLRSSSIQQQFVCCVPTAAAISDRCIDPKATVEFIGDVERKCTPNTNSCSNGFSCQPSRKNGWLCCSIRAAAAQFTCPLPGQQPVRTTDGSNQFCSRPGQRDDCPQRALCLSSGNSPNLFICCYSAAFQVTPICPNNGVPQPAPFAENYKSCSMTSLDDCDSGFSCVRSANDYSVQMCCTVGLLQPQQPVCPSQATLLTERGRPVYCTLSQPLSCPKEYSCQQAVGTPGTFVCCSGSKTHVCPAPYSAAIDGEGNQIFCSPSNISDCPGGSSCLESTQDTSVHLCCRKDEAPRVCPRNQNALLTASGSLEFCNAPGQPCYQEGYTCQWSATLAQYVCCGRTPVPAHCADGRSTYEQISGQTYSCNPLVFPSSCPIGYECDLSTVSGISVCCAIETTTTTTTSTTSLAPVLPPVTAPEPLYALQCPSGWNPYRNDLGFQPRSCSGLLDMSCPIGYSCSPSTVVGNFICCRLATSVRCLTGDTFLANTFPRLCNRFRSGECPRGYTCQQSSQPTISICCGTGLSVDRTLCYNGREPALLNGYVRSCPTEGSADGCPGGHTCQRASNGLLVCCSSSYSRSEIKPTTMEICPESRQPVFSPGTNEIVYCDQTAFTCSNKKACLPKVKSDRYVCCSDIPRCSVGTGEVGLGGALKKCINSVECSPGNVCRPSNVDGVHLCCSSGAIPAGEVVDTLSKVSVANVDDEDWVVIEG
ncbi:hypothetical protein RB195_020339 [Necator americanus]|uniref:EB module n=1 Tax=Necator americanus TaxID=51031 RepID=A0ABR1CID1_NECAM